MAEGNLSITALLDIDNSTEARIPMGELAEAIELLEQARGTLECLEMFDDPNVDLSGFVLEAQIKRMALAAGAVSRLVTQAQTFLIQAPVSKSEAHHG